MIFETVFDTCVALQKGDEVTALVDGHRILAFELYDKYVLVMDGTLLREGDPYDVAIGFARTLKSLDRGPKYSVPKQTSHTRLTALKDVPILGVETEKSIRRKR